MSKFEKNFTMTEADAAQYAREKLDFFPAGARLESREIGDGNINYVFRVEDADTGRSVIIKHADATVRHSDQPMSTDRCRIEAELLRLQGELSPGHAPEVYLYDPVMSCIVMQDLRDYENLRYALIARKTFPTLGEDMAGFMADTLLGTTDCLLPADEKKRRVQRYINPALCAVTERLVFTAPYTNFDGSNEELPVNRGFYREMLYEDAALKLEAAKLKELFKGKAQALLHGDLHTGSIFVKPGSTMVLDPEFAFYGPAGYDVGNLMANLLFAWASARATMAAGEKRDGFLGWLEETLAQALDGFRQRALRLLKERATDRMAESAGFAEWYVADILADAAGFAGTELIRRTIGSAKVKDIAGIADEQARGYAERVCILAGRACILERKRRYQRGADYLETIHTAAEAAL